MEYVTLSNSPVINGEVLSTFINILDVTGNTANVNISNSEATIHTITITNSVEESVENYFSQYYK